MSKLALSERCVHVLQCAAVCCSVMQCVAVLRFVAQIHIDSPRHFPEGLCMSCSVLQCVAVRYSVAVCFLKGVWVCVCLCVSALTVRGCVGVF